MRATTGYINYNYKKGVLFYEKTTIIAFFGHIDLMRSDIYQLK